MTAKIIPFTDKQTWLKHRVQDVTSTEISALYGLSPYMSAFELFHQKRDGQVVEIDDNERMLWGRRLEDTIAHGAAEDQNWVVEKMDCYMRDPDDRIGSSFDYKIIGHDDSAQPGIMEIKNVDGIVYSRNWIDDGNGNIEAPEHIELQVQHQMEVADIDWCAIVALVGGNTQKIILRQRDKNIGQDIRARVKGFWQAVEANDAPDPDYTKDADFIIKELRNSATANLVAEANAELEDMIKQYQFVNKEAKDMANLAKQYKAQILEMAGDASKILTSFGATVSCGMTKPSEGTLITPDMVGTYVGGRAGFRSFRVNQKKEK